jgi:hypothetical protein
MPTMTVVKWARGLVVCLATLTVGGCSSVSLVDSIPSWAGGPVEGTPERPAALAEYPPVNDRPPPRPTKLITEAEQTKLESELIAARAKQDIRAKEVRKGREEMLANPPKLPPLN